VFPASLALSELEAALVWPTEHVMRTALVKIRKTALRTAPASTTAAVFRTAPAAGLALSRTHLNSEVAVQPEKAVHSEPEALLSNRP